MSHDDRDQDKSRRWKDGLAVYGEMFGAERARNRLNAADPQDRRLTDLLFEYAYGSVWNGPVLARRERSLVTVALLAGLGRNDELETHVGAALANGCTRAELHEIMVQVGLYCGFPAALGGHKVLKKTDPDRA